MFTRNLINAAVIVAAMVGGAALISCDRASYESTTVKETPSGTKVQKTTVTEHGDGTVSKEKTEQTIQH
jgi:hypothetical protein